jgi:hypothetical protein
MNILNINDFKSVNELDLSLQILLLAALEMTPGIFTAKTEEEKGEANKLLAMTLSSSSGFLRHFKGTRECDFGTYYLSASHHSISQM